LQVDLPGCVRGRQTAIGEQAFIVDRERGGRGDRAV
jgi:hypothetical protein